MTYKILFFLCILNIGMAQVGGESTFEFLNISNSARSQYLGRGAMATDDGDISLLSSNPAFLNQKMNKKALLSANFHFGGVLNNAEYANQFKKIGMMGMGIHVLSYGEVKKRDANGTQIGIANPIDFYINTQYALPFQKYKIGVNAKVIVSHLSTVNSYGCAIDLGVIRTDSAAQQSIAFLIKNFGGQVIQYNNIRESLPFDILFAYSKRFKHLPFRITLTAHDLYRWNITYDDPNQMTTSSLSGNSTPISNYSIVDNIFRHLTFSGEFYFGKAIRIGLNYDHQRRSELVFDTNRGLAGFSFGLGIVTKKFDFGYALGKFSPVGASNHLTIVLKMNEMVKKK